MATRRSFIAAVLTLLGFKPKVEAEPKLYWSQHPKFRVHWVVYVRRLPLVQSVNDNALGGLTIASSNGDSA